MVFFALVMSSFIVTCFLLASAVCMVAAYGVWMRVVVSSSSMVVPLILVNQILIMCAVLTGRVWVEVRSLSSTCLVGPMKRPLSPFLPNEHSAPLPANPSPHSVLE